MLTKKMTPWGCLTTPSRPLYMYMSVILKDLIFFSKIPWSIIAIFHVELPGEVGKNVYINGSGHAAKMATSLIYGKNLQNLLQNKRSYDLET